MTPIENKDELKKRIIEKAAEQFFKYGITNTTTQQIASELEISKKTLYQYFKTKDDLLLAVLELKHKQVENEILCLVNNGQLDYVTKLKLLMAIIGTHNAKHCPQFCRDLQKYYQRKHGQSRPTALEMLPLIEQFLAEGMQKKMIRDDISLGLIMLIITNALENMFKMDSKAREDFSLSEILDVLPKVLAEGILTKQAQEQYWD